MKRQMWEILVPAASNDGRVFDPTFHFGWDEKVKKISGGLTILKTTKGKWTNPSGKVFVEKMIPVRILATRKEIDKIVDMTAEFYKQEAVLAYKIADEVILKHFKRGQHA